MWLQELQTDSGQQLDTNSKQHGSSDQQVQASVLQVVEQQQQRQTAAEVLPGSESTAAAAGNQQRLAAELQDVAVQQPAAAATPAVAPNDAFGALMAASKGKTLVGGDSNSSKLSAEEMQQQADRCVTSSVQHGSTGPCRGEFAVHVSGSAHAVHAASHGGLADAWSTLCWACKSSALHWPWMSPAQLLL